ncbi:MAG: HAD-IC family P-type ATPase [Bacilli bacterium]|nr:HAD-IC family P-type ATPase [Bacilli bacterium]
MNKINGLSKEEVLKLKNKGLTNVSAEVKTKSIGQIIFTNFFTLFNFLNFFLALLIFIVHSYKNLLFLGVVFCNTLISTIQEIRSKKIIDKLSLLNETKATVIRDGYEVQIGIHDIVLGDVIKLKSGNQIVTDSVVLNGEILVNESLITGESEAISKTINSDLLSGSFVVGGECLARAIHVGNDNYTSQISAEAKYVKKVNSEIMNFINKIIKYISIAIVPIGVLLFLNQMQSNNFNEATVHVVAALIGMIPEGLVLLTSTVLAISVMRLAKYNVLVQELYCIETLARVDTICLDKTGTITTGKMDVSKIIPLNDYNNDEILDILGIVSYHMKDDNQTMEAIYKKYAKENNYKIKKIVPFSSQKKWSGISFEDVTYILGAPEIILKDTSMIDKELNQYVDNNRVLLLTKSSKVLDKSIPNDIEPLALIILNDQIRKEARDTLEYFKSQGVLVKLISGDNPKTVAGVASSVGLKNIKYIDMSKCNEPIIDIVSRYNVFGRVKPNQKKEIIVALKAKGHTVAMTGDGVNDVLALKEADCSVAMNSGSDAARNVSQLVLLDSNFSSMPKVVMEGRRSINNIQRSSSLFLCKTIYATLLAIIFVFLNMSYPFVPIQLTLISMVTIGIPSFVLALEANSEKINGKIIVNVLKRSLPTALTIVCNILIVMMLSSIFNFSEIETSTLCVCLTAITGFMLLYKISIPFNLLRKVLLNFLIALFCICVLFFKNFFSLSLINFKIIVLIIAFSVIAFTLFNLFTFLFYKISRKLNN